MYECYVSWNDRNRDFDCSSILRNDTKFLGFSVSQNMRNSLNTGRVYRFIILRDKIFGRTVETLGGGGEAHRSWRRNGFVLPGGPYVSAVASCCSVVTSDSRLQAAHQLHHNLHTTALITHLFARAQHFLKRLTVSHQPV